MMKAILLTTSKSKNTAIILSDISETADIEEFKNSLTYDEYVEDCKARAAVAVHPLKRERANLRPR